MVVEDDEFARTLVGRALDPQAWETLFAIDGNTALAQLRRHRHLKASSHLLGVLSR